jgi:predicted anti-sigma-YlaC factor YlaD
MSSPLDHAAVQELFTDYRDGTLAAEKATEVRDHLASCEACRKEYDEFVQAVTSLGRLRTQAPPNFLSGIQTQIRRRSRGRFFVRRTARFPLELVSLITLMIMLVVYLFLTFAEPKKVHEGGGRPGAAGTR